MYGVNWKHSQVKEQSSMDITDLPNPCLFSGALSMHRVSESLCLRDPIGCFTHSNTVLNFHVKKMEQKITVWIFLHKSANLWQVWTFWIFTLCVSTKTVSIQPVPWCIVSANSSSVAGELQEMFQELQQSNTFAFLYVLPDYLPDD